MIERERRFRALSRTELATLSGVAPRYIARVESGKQVPNLTCAERLANAFGMVLSELIRHAEDDHHQPVS